uniref:Uncharacterized protein n=1 Tax=Magallana gigas TaxID=29159 RepID=K1S5Q6_MAGGI
MVFFEGDETASQSKRSRRALLPEPEEPRQDTHLEIPAVPEMMDLLPPQADVSTREDRMSPEKPRADISVGHELSSMEIPRDASVSMERSLLQEDITPVQLQLSVRSKDDSFSDRSSSSRRKRSRSRGSIEEEVLAPPSEPSVSDTLSRINLNLSVVPEEPEIPMMETPLPVFSKVSQAESRLIRLINSYTSEVDYTTFEEICPPHLYDRKQAASLFVLFQEVHTKSIKIRRKSAKESEVCCQYYHVRGYEDGQTYGMTETADKVPGGR